MKPVGILGLLLIISGGLAVAFDENLSITDEANHFAFHSVNAPRADGSTPFGVPPALTACGLLGGMVLVIAGHKR